MLQVVPPSPPPNEPLLYFYGRSELLVPGLEAGGGYVENRNAPWDPQSMDQGVTT